LLTESGFSRLSVLSIKRGNMKYIASRENSIWKRAFKLKQKRARDKEGLYLAEGPNLIEEALKEGSSLESVFFRAAPGTEDPEPAFEPLAELLEEKGVLTAVLRSELFAQLCDTETPAGVMSILRKEVLTPEEFFSLPCRGYGNLLVLDRIQDPGNLGTLLRTADGAGYEGVMVLKGSGDVYSPKVVRSTAGSLLRMPILMVDTPEEALTLLKAHGKKVLCSCPHNGVDYELCPMAENTALVVGNEASGACEAFLQEADHLVRIPMKGPAESLNASVAAGVLMFESLRQARCAGK